MLEFLAQTFSNDLVPHGYCIAWRPGLLWLHVASDALIALSYFAIPIGLYRLLRNREDFPFPGLFRLFAAFIFACGSTHLLGIWTIWRPDYGIEGLAKAATAAVSFTAAIVFVRSAPTILELPSIRELEALIADQTRKLTAANEDLRRQIAHRDEIERALAEREARLRSIVNTAVSAIVTIDESGVVESANPAAAQLFGYAQSEIVGRNVSMLMDSPDRERHDEHLRRYLATGASRIMGVVREVTGRRKDGTPLPLELAVSEFESRRGRRFTGILSDISARTEYERQLAESVAALEARNAELDDFAHTVSHDLKEPLRGIQTLCWALDEDLGGRLPEEARRDLDGVRRLAERMQRMIDAVLDYSRLGRETRLRPIDLNALLQEALDMLHATLRERSCTVHIPRPLPRANCDPTATAEVFRNLISNASKYSDNTEKRIEIGWTPDEDSGAVKLFVRDDGIGIETKRLEDIFRIFYRLENDGEHGGGTGAGLAIVKKLVERQGGRVWAESAPGEGATFWLTLRAAPSERS